MAIALRKSEEIALLAKANQIVAGTLALLQERAKPGVSLLELDRVAEEFILGRGAKPSFKGLYGFPRALCTSVNEVIIHGIPTDYELQNGDIVGLDVGVEYGGWFGDGAVTLGVGKISQEDTALLACSREVLLEAIEAIEEGMRFKELSATLQSLIQARGFIPLYGFCGHGIGKKPHEEPEIPNYLEGGHSKQGPKIREGMVFCLEPMVCQKQGEARILADHWSVVSVDGLRGSHHEHTVAIINKRARILSQE